MHAWRRQGCIPRCLRPERARARQSQPVILVEGSQEGGEGREVGGGWGAREAQGRTLEARAAAWEAIECPAVACEALAWEALVELHPVVYGAWEDQSWAGRPLLGHGVLAGWRYGEARMSPLPATS